MDNIERPAVQDREASYAKHEVDHVNQSSALPTLDNKEAEYAVPGTVHFADDDVHQKTTWRSWLAVGACCIAIYTQVFVVVASAQVIAFIARDLAAYGNIGNIGWLIQAPVLVQSVLSPVYGRISDIVDRRYLAAIPPILAAVGAAIAAKATDINMLIGGSILIGFSLPTIAIVQAIPSEILPLRFRGVANGACYLAGSTASITGGLLAGGLVKNSSWRNIYWIQLGLHILTTVSLLVAYHPPKSTAPRMAMNDLIWACDPIGILLLTGGATLTLIALNWAPAVYPWSSGHVLGLLITGIVLFIAFGLYEWKGRSDGMINHVFFKRNKNFGLSIFAFAVEGFLFFGAVNQFTNQIVLNLGFQTDPFLITVRQLVFGFAGFIGSIILTIWATKTKDLKTPLLVSFFSFLGGVIAYATIKPTSRYNTLQVWLFNLLAGFGQAGPLTLIPALVQFTAPPALLGTATGLSFSGRAIGGAFGSAIMGTVINSRLGGLQDKVANAAIGAGLPSTSVAALLEAFSLGTPLTAVAGASDAVIQAAVSTSRNVYAEAYRIGWSAVIPFVVVAIISVALLKGVQDQMTWHVDRPLDKDVAAVADEKNAAV